MKSAIREAAALVPFDLEEIDVDSSAVMKDKYGFEVPVLFIDGRKAFKYRVTAKRLEQRLRRSMFWARLGLARRGE
jgi:hypothetical protein